MPADPRNPKKDTDADDKMTVIVPPSKKPAKKPDVDVDMADAADGAEPVVDPLAQAVSDIKTSCALLDRGVTLFDARFSLRALRSISLLRKRLTPEVIAAAVVEIYPASSASISVAKGLLAAVGREGTAFASTPADMEIDSEPKKLPAAKKDKDVKDVFPEVGVYLSILVQVFLLDNKEFDKGAKFSTDLAEHIHSLNRRTLDSLAAKVYFYLSLFFEQLSPKAPSPQSPIVSIRPILLKGLRTAVLRSDTDTQAAVIVLLLRSYLLTSSIEQADLLVSHTQFPENASNNQVARFLYYLGRIRATQLRYTEAHEHLTAASRKAPSSACAVGFTQSATKMLIVVELLMGDIPERATFRQSMLESSLQPYFQLVQAVRVGNLDLFEKVIVSESNAFRKDNTYSLVLRLRQNVIKTGIRMMSLSYSRIPLRDICIRLQLGSEESAEYIVAKAIRDGVIEATLDREHGFMKSKDIGDVYATREPADAFHDRIRACLALHDESVKAMRFPMNQHRLELKNAQEAREREREMADDIQNGDLDDEDIGGDFDGI
ncbi:hypothetical protein BROUX41_006551 [Berkeleyomyces rouxiae]|uniref:uncharacterized protein n=1 Tax=Berkeleyomyces rouxiae TaxID=2035830 RepID=UPI003B81F61E